jgi:hypothetical protein
MREPTPCLLFNSKRLIRIVIQIHYPSIIIIIPVMDKHLVGLISLGTQPA